MTTIELLYGRGTLPVELPDGVRATVVRKPAMPVLDDPDAAIAAAFDEPVGCPPLDELAKGRSTACIVVCDITRPVPNGLFLRPLVERLTAAGVPLDGISILVACGLHRVGSDDELAEIIGDPWVSEHVAAYWHDARATDEIADLGRTPTRDVPIHVNRRLVDADLRIVTGLVEPHFMAGWSGGRKVVAPGVAGHETIRTFHSARFMEDPLAVQCNLDGNPLHEEQLEIVKVLGDVYAINTVIDEDRRLAQVTFGEVVASHLESVAFVEAYARVAVGRRFATVVTSSAGYPLDKTYYQTVKGMVTPLDILEPGGTLVIASECSEGLGSPEFRESQRRLVELGVEDFAASLLTKQLADVDEWETEMQLKPMRRGSVRLFTTGLDDGELRDTGVEVVGDVAAAIAEAVARSGDADVAVVPEGPYVIPVVD